MLLRKLDPIAASLSLTSPPYARWPLFLRPYSFLFIRGEFLIALWVAGMPGDTISFGVRPDTGYRIAKTHAAVAVTMS